LAPYQPVRRPTRCHRCHVTAIMTIPQPSFDKRARFLLAGGLLLYFALRLGFLDPAMNWIYVHLPLWMAISNILLGCACMIILVHSPANSRLRGWRSIALVLLFLFIFLNGPSRQRAREVNPAGVWDDVFYISFAYGFIIVMFRKLRYGRDG